MHPISAPHVSKSDRYIFTQGRSFWATCCASIVKIALPAYINVKKCLSIIEAPNFQRTLGLVVKSKLPMLGPRVRFPEGANTGLLSVKIFFIFGGGMWKNGHCEPKWPSNQNRLPPLDWAGDGGSNELFYSVSKAILDPQRRYLVYHFRGDIGGEIILWCYCTDTKLRAFSTLLTVVF